jgi:hypothetical protein
VPVVAALNVLAYLGTACFCSFPCEAVASSSNQCFLPAGPPATANSNRWNQDKPSSSVPSAPAANGSAAVSPLQSPSAHTPPAADTAAVSGGPHGKKQPLTTAASAATVSGAASGDPGVLTAKAGLNVTAVPPVAAAAGAASDKVNAPASGPQHGVSEVSLPALVAPAGPAAAASVSGAEAAAPPVVRIPLRCPPPAPATCFAANPLLEDDGEDGEDEPQDVLALLRDGSMFENSL